MIECGHAEAAPGAWLANLLPAGGVGLRQLRVGDRAERGSGVGAHLVSTAVGALESSRRGVRGTYLYYNPPNPLSSVFWPRVGYAPLWTLWEVRPAAGLR